METINLQYISLLKAMTKIQYNIIPLFVFVKSHFKVYLRK